MILNIEDIKTEALLLFCRDLIQTYQNSDIELFKIDKKLKIFISKHIEDLSKAINTVALPNEYYLRNAKVSRISMIIKQYSSLNKMVSKYLYDNAPFNPAMLCFSLLATWFKELEQATNSKQYVVFTIYPYWEIYDSLLINIEDNDYKKLNSSMIDIAETVILKYYKKGLNV